MSSTPWTSPNIKTLTATAGERRWLARARKPFEQKLAKWVKKRQGVDLLPVTLASRRIYILPTAIGITFGLTSFAMLLGSMNYNNSMGFALTFLLVAIGLVSMHQCHRNLTGVNVRSVSARPVFAGDKASFEIRLHNPSAATRLDIYAYCPYAESTPTDLAALADEPLHLNIPTHARGSLQLSRFGLATLYPLQLLRTWSWLHAQATCIVWPAPADHAPPRPLAPSRDAGDFGREGDEDFAGLRDFRESDSPKHIAWKTFAKSGELKSKQFEGSNQSTTWIEYSAVTELDPERALRILSRWIVDADAAGDTFGLRMPNTQIAPGRGRAHRDRCLTALALHDGASSTSVP